MSDHDLQQQTNIKMLGRYEILQRLGRGGMGDVWLCEDPRLHRQVAIKTLPVHNQQDQEFVARFEHEARAAAALNHPHILPVHDYGRQPLPNGSLITYIVMPYIRGGSLSNHIALYSQQKTLMPFPEAIAFLTQAAEAIDYAHEQQVIHRDIKPANMLLRDDKWLLLADFGIARILTSADRLTATGPGFGTADYMAPEQAQGQAVISSDNYSLAVIAYQLFTGQLPFQADTSYAITIQHLTMPPPPPRQVNPHLSPAFEQILLQGLAKQPAQRPASAIAFVEALQKALLAAPSETTYRTIAPSQTVDRFTSPDNNQAITEQKTVLADNTQQSNAQLLLTRRRLLLGGSAAAVVAIGGGLGAWKLASTSGTKQGATQPEATVKITKSPDAPMFVLTGHNQPAETLAWHPQKHILVSASGQDARMITWDIDTLLKQPLKTPSYTERAYIKNPSPLEAWSSDGKYLAIISNGSSLSGQNIPIDLYTLNAQTLVPEQTTTLTIPTQNTIYGFGWLQNRYFVTVEQGITQNPQFLLRMSDITQPKTTLAPVIFKNMNLAVNTGTNLSIIMNALAISPDNSTLAICLADSILVGQINRVGNTLAWKASTSPLQSLTNSLTDSLVGVAWSADGSKIVSADVEHPAFVPTFWNWHESKPRPQASGIPDQNNPPPALSALATNPASITPCLATGNNNGEIMLWNATAGALPIKTLNNGGVSEPVVALAWSHDGHWLAASFEDTSANILIWKL